MHDPYNIVENPDPDQLTKAFKCNKKRFFIYSALCYSTVYCLIIGFIMTVSYASLKNMSEFITGSLADWQDNRAI